MELNKWYKMKVVKPQVSVKGMENCSYFLGINTEGKTLVFGGFIDSWDSEHWFIMDSKDSLNFNDIIWWMPLP